MPSSPIESWSSWRCTRMRLLWRLTELNGWKRVQREGNDGWACQRIAMGFDCGPFFSFSFAFFRIFAWMSFFLFIWASYFKISLFLFTNGLHCFHVSWHIRFNLSYLICQILSFPYVFFFLISDWWLETPNLWDFVTNLESKPKLIHTSWRDHAECSP